jgi:ADP-heptose:LPS heptosyltransferase
VALTERIAVLRALPGVGDLLCAVPAFRAIRVAHPGSRVTLIGLSSAAWFVDRFCRYVDDLLVLDAWPGLPEVPGTPAAARAFLERARACRFGLALQLHGDGTVTNDLIERVAAERVAGMTGLGSPRRGGFAGIDERTHEVERLLMAVRAAGIPTPSSALEWPERPSDAIEARAAIPDDAVPYAVIHPGGSLASRRWDARGFAAVGDELAEHGWRIVLTGVGAERPVADTVRRAMTSSVVDLVGRVSLGAAAAIVRRAAAVITNDTGMSHLAAAAGTPSVVVFTVTDPARWKPIGERHHAVIAGALEPTVRAVLAVLAEVPSR